MLAIFVVPLRQKDHKAKRFGNFIKCVKWVERMNCRSAMDLSLESVQTIQEASIGEQRVSRLFSLIRKREKTDDANHPALCRGDSMDQRPSQPEESG